MPKVTLTLKKTELLPPMTQAQATDLITFLRVNADLLEELNGEFESCCASDDGPVWQSYVYDSLRLGYGLLTPERYIANNGIGDYDE